MSAPASFLAAPPDMVQGARPTVDAAKLRATIRQIDEQLPIPGVEYEVTITYKNASEGVPPLALALLQGRIERARQAAERVLRSGKAGIPAELEDAIALVIGLRQQLKAQQPRGTSVHAMKLRGELFDAVDHLGMLFDTEAGGAPFAGGGDLGAKAF